MSGPITTADLRTVLQIAASLLNAAGWKTFTTGSITGSDQTLTVTEAAFTAADIGKTVCVDGAGTDGGILQTVIQSINSPTSVELAVAASNAVAGATVSYGGRLIDDRRNLFELRELAFEADEDFYVPIAETLGHWARQDLMTLSASIANAGEISHIGELGKVLIQIGPSDPYLPGKPAEFEEITRLRANTGVAPLNVYGALAHNVAGSQIGGHYRISEDGDYVYYTGTDCKIRRIAPYARGANLQSPAIFTGAIASRMVARALAKEGARTPEHSAAHAAYSQSVIDGIKARAKPIPTLEEYEAKAREKKAA